MVVQWEYASEERLAARNAIYESLLRDGENANEVVSRIAEGLSPRRVLEVGCGMGEAAEHLGKEGIEVVAVDLSPRMVELARERGVDASVGDVQDLPFADGEFDVVIAAWVLYHIPELERALREIVRVLEQGGHLVAATVGPENMREIWDLVGASATIERSFDARTGRALLERHFSDVEQRDVEGTLVFDSADAVRHFISMTMTRAHLASRVPELDEPLSTKSRHTIFVARK